MVNAARLTWIDLLRGLAVVGMIATHVVNAILDSAYDVTPWLKEFRYFAGIVAPTFLWIAGYVQGLAVIKAQQTGRAIFSWSRVQRLLIILLIAYLLHVPWGYWLAGDFGPESWRLFLQSDILHCLVISLLVLMLAGQWAGRGFIGVIFALFLANIIIGPFALNWKTGWVFIDAFLNKETGSLFPLFPWFAFCAAGCLASHSHQRDSRVTDALLGVALIIAGYVLKPESYTSATPIFFFERLGWVCLGVVTVQTISPYWSPRWLQLAGRESLLMYVSHLVFIYALPIGSQPLDKLLGHTQSITVCVAIFLVILATCIALAWLNEWKKRRVTDA